MRLVHYAAALALVVVLAGVMLALDAPRTIATHVSGAAHSFIVNTTTKPVWVRDVNDGRVAHEDYFATTINYGDTACAEGVAVPTGKRWVIQHVSVQVYTPSPVTAAAVKLGRQGCAATQNYALPLERQGSLYGTDLFVFGGPVTLHVEPGERLNAVAFRDGTAPAVTVEVAASGYLVSVP